jgi:CTP:phosphocholine cytidylyltransferase-like protein
VLEYQINQLLAIDPNIKITISIGFESEKIIHIIDKYSKSNINFLYNDSYKTTNQSFSIKLFLEEFIDTKNLLVVSSGVLWKTNTIDRHTLSGISKIFTIDKEKENFQLGCSSENNITEYIFYGLPRVWSECVYLNHDAILAIRHIIEQKSIDQMYLFEIINAIITNKIMVLAHSVDKKRIMKINNQKDIGKARLFI